jgi:hypothetical protein
LDWIRRAQIRTGVELCASPLGAGLVAGFVYLILAGSHRGGFKSSRFAYFNYLADAFWHGQLHLRLLPASTHDLSEVGGRFYLYWPPFPAVLLMPFVALWGVSFSDVIFTALVGAADVALVALLLRSAVAHGLVELSRLQRGWLLLFFAFGTVHFTLAPLGRVWFTSQVVGFGCVAVAYWAAIELRGFKAFGLVGVSVAAALLTRHQLVFAGLWPAAYLLWKHVHSNAKATARYVAAGVFPVLIAVALLAAYNAFRFGGIAEAGLGLQQMGSEYVGDFGRFGAFSLHYVPTNLFYQYLYYPFPIRDGSFMGGGLFWLSSPFLAAIPAALWSRPRWSARTLVISILLVATPILLLLGTGFAQFGPRYTLDFTVPLLLLTAIGVQRWPIRVLQILVLISIAQYGLGIFYFMRVLQY